MNEITFLLKDLYLYDSTILIIKKKNQKSNSLSLPHTTSGSRIATGSEITRTTEGLTLHSFIDSHNEMCHFMVRQIRSFHKGIHESNTVNKNNLTMC